MRNAPEIQQFEPQYMPNPEKRRGRHGTIVQRLSLLVAVVLVALLVGSMVVVLQITQHAKTGIAPQHTITGAGQDPAQQQGPQYHQSGLYATMMDGVYRIDPTTNKVLWHYTMNPVILQGNGVGGSTNRVNTPITVAGGTVYFGGNNDSGNYVYALDAVTGTLRWQKALDYAQNQPFEANGVVYVGTYMSSPDTQKAHIYALKASDGTTLWSQTMDAGNVSVGAITNTTIYAYSANNLYALSAKDGHILWESQAITASQYFDALQEVNGVLYASSSEISQHSATETQYCYQYAYSPVTGKQIWRSQAVNGFVISPPTIANNVMYYGSQNDNLYALNTRNGQQLWSYTGTASFYPSPQVANGVIYAAEVNSSGSDGAIVALNNNGTLRWSVAATNINTGSTQLALWNGQLYYGDDNGIVHVLRTSDGSEVASYKLGNAQNETPVLTLVP